MADDDEGTPSSTPWGRSGRRAPDQPTPPPGSVPGTPPPGSGDPATWYAPPPGTPAPPPGTPAPPPGAPAPFSLDKAPAGPVHAPPPSGQHWTVPEPPPPGAPGGPIYPPGVYPPPPPKKGGGGAVLAIVAVVVVLLLIGAAVLGLFVLRSDDEEARSSSGTSVDVATSAPAGSGTTPPTDGPDSTELPSSTDDPGSTDPTVPDTPSVPGAGDLTPPDAIPRPDGAAPGIVGLEVPGQTVEQVTQYYLDALPAAGFTVGDVQDLGTITVIPVTGNGLEGQLSITNVSPLPTSVIWTAY